MSKHTIDDGEGGSQERREAQRSKQIGFGFNTEGYKNMMLLIEHDPRLRNGGVLPILPPPVGLKGTKRAWDVQIRRWRRALHMYDHVYIDGVTTDRSLEEVIAAQRFEWRAKEYQSQRSLTRVKLTDDELLASQNDQCVPSKIAVDPSLIHLLRSRNHYDNLGETFGIGGDAEGRSPDGGRSPTDVSPRDEGLMFPPPSASATAVGLAPPPSATTTSINNPASPSAWGLKFVVGPEGSAVLPSVTQAQRGAGPSRSAWKPSGVKANHDGGRSPSPPASLSPAAPPPTPATIAAASGSSSAAQHHDPLTAPRYCVTQSTAAVDRQKQQTPLTLGQPQDEENAIAPQNLQSRFDFAATGNTPAKKPPQPTQSALSPFAKDFIGTRLPVNQHQGQAQTKR